MGVWLRKLLELVLPWLFEERVSRRVLYWTFWICTAVIAWLFIMSNPVFGWFMAAAPAVLVWRTHRQGLAGVNPLLFGVCIGMTLFPAFFLGMYQTGDTTPSGLVLVGFLVFLVWGAAFPTVLDHEDRAWLRGRPGMADMPPGPNPAAAPRVLLVRLFMATVVMMAVGEWLAAAVCVAGLVWRNRLTAVLAAVACLVLPLLSVGFGAIVWDADLLDVAAALVSADQWRGAIMNPGWSGGLPRRIRRVR